MLMFLLLIMASCSGSKSFPELGKVTRIEARTNEKENVKTIVDPGQISKIVAFVDAHRSGWGGSGDMYGVPVPRIILDFYDADNFKGHFGIGKGFVETQRVGAFASRSISEREAQEFLNLIGMSDESLLRK